MRPLSAHVSKISKNSRSRSPSPSLCVTIPYKVACSLVTLDLPQASTVAAQKSTGFVKRHDAVSLGVYHRLADGSTAWINGAKRPLYDRSAHALCYFLTLPLERYSRTRPPVNVDRGHRDSERNTLLDLDQWNDGA